MRLLSILVLGFFLSSCDQHHDPPNILMIVVDDLGYSDIHCYGNDMVETPIID